MPNEEDHVSTLRAALLAKLELIEPSEGGDVHDRD